MVRSLNSGVSGIQSFQGNRNPFIDHPEWAACLFRDQCTATPPADRIFADGFE